MPVAPFVVALALISADSSVTATTTASTAISNTPRELPDYDGRGPEGTSAGEVLLWAPRILLSPLYFVSEFIIRRPLGWLVVTAEREQLPTLILDFFTFGEERTAGIFPSALIDFGFRPSIGVYAFWNELLAKENGARLYAAYGGSDWYAFRFTDRVSFDENNRVALTFGFTHRPDYRFEGIGPRPPQDLLLRYRSERIEGIASWDSLIGDAGYFSVFGGAHTVDFDLGEGGCCSNRALEDAIAAGDIESPPGFGQNYAVWEHGITVEFDTRKARPSDGNGARLEMKASQSFPLSSSLLSPWVTFGGAVGGFFDLTDKNRVLSLFISGEFIEPIEHDQVVPFTELVTVGGAGLLPGFRPGTFIGQSRVSGTLEYHWPIWAFLDGSMHFGVGNVFGERLEGFRWDLLRASFGLGMRTVGRRDHAFNILVAAGTEPFENGVKIDSFRFVIGTSRGF